MADVRSLLLVRLELARARSRAQHGPHRGTIGARAAYALDVLGRDVTRRVRAAELLERRRREAA